MPDRFVPYSPVVTATSRVPAPTAGRDCGHPVRTGLATLAAAGALVLAACGQRADRAGGGERQPRRGDRLHDAAPAEPGHLPLRRSRTFAASPDVRPGPRLQRRVLSGRPVGRVHVRARGQRRPLRSRPGRGEASRSDHSARGPGRRRLLLAERRAAGFRQHARRRCRHLRHALCAGRPEGGVTGGEPHAPSRRRLPTGLLPGRSVGSRTRGRATGGRA